MNLQATLGGITYTFKSLKEVMAKANEEKSGDRLAGIAAETVQERIAAKTVIS
ncbi:MAG: ethanolamine ammonia-lyase subunit EutB, partial [Planococcus donghaensis]